MDVTEEASAGTALSFSVSVAGACPEHVTAVNLRARSTDVPTESECKHRRCQSTR